MQTSQSKMRAVVITGPQAMCIESVAKPEPGPREVRVKLEGCGVCGSNLPPWEGRPWFKYPLNPGEPGHEGWGIIDAIGAEVKRFKAGERVALLSYRAYAEYDVADEASLVRTPPNLGGNAFPGEALGCAMNVFRRCEIEPGQTVAIVGIGFLGAVLTALSARAGARVIAISRRGLGLEIARKLGAETTIPLADHSAVVNQVFKLTDGRRCDRVIEATGYQEPLDLASELTRERGQLVIAGYHQDGLRQVNLQLWNWRGLDVINAHERDPKVYGEGMQRAAEAVGRGELDTKLLYTHSFTLDQFAEAMNTLRTRPEGFLKAWIRIC